MPGVRLVEVSLETVERVREWFVHSDSGGCSGAAQNKPDKCPPVLRGQPARCFAATRWAPRRRPLLRVAHRRTPLQETEVGSACPRELIDQTHASP